jgi:S-adenosylmethionine hydrolase
VGRRYDTVTFLSDYGLDDEFVGVVKSVIRDLARHVTVIDLSHGIAPHDVRAGALLLARSVQYVAGGVLLAVVDPGVGTDRRAIGVEVAGGQGVLLGPDNGLLAPAVAMAGGAGRTVVLSNREYQLEAPGATFAGRDVFAPAAAHLCNGVDLNELGDAVDPDNLLPGTVPLPRVDGDALLAEVLWVDRFGNAQLNVGPDDVVGWGDQVRVVIGGTRRVATVADAYDDVTGAGIGLVVDSYGLLSIALDRQSAADALGLGAGEGIRLERLDDGDGGDGGGRDAVAPARLPPPQRRR